jgi:hypothetical protein
MPARPLGHVVIVGPCLALVALGSILAPGGTAAATAVAGSQRPATSSAASTTTALLPAATSSLTTADLQRVRATRVLFGHQSVGWNIVDGIGAVYSSRALAAPRFVVGAAPVSRSGFFAHDGIGSNGAPATKIRDFAARLRGGAAARVDVAFMKLCYVDITAGTDVKAVFTQYSRTVRALRTSFPRLVLLHLTVPLTTGSPSDNAARGRYNALLRQAYGASGRLVDIAAAESVSPTGARVTVAYRGARYQAMYAGYTSDGGHLNALGSRRVAAALLLRLSRAPR